MIQKREDDDNEHYSPEETARRRDEALRRALNTPRKTLKDRIRQKHRDAKKQAKRRPR